MDPINWHSFFFLLFALVACWFAVAVAVSGNIVRMAFYLVISLGAVAGLFFLADADFVGAMQLMIYVGGTLVLLVFGVMLTSRTPFVTLKTARGQWALALLAGGSLLAVLLQAAWSVHDWTAPAVARHDVQAAMETPPTATSLGLGLLGIRVDQLNEGPGAGGQRKQVLREGMSGYLLPFEIISVHLLVVLVGAAYLARTKRRVPSRQPPQ